MLFVSCRFAYQKTPLHGILKESCDRLWQVTGTCHMQQTALSACNTLAIRKQKSNNVASQPAQPQLQFVCLTDCASVCVCVSVCQNNATGHKFNLANKHVGLHTNTHTQWESEREAAGDVCRLCVTKTNCSHVQNCLAGQFLMLVECFSHFQHFSQVVQVCYRVYFIFFTGSAFMFCS